MLKIKKHYNRKIILQYIIALIVSFLFLFSGIAYSCQKDSLRVPVAQGSTYERIIGAMYSGEARFEALKRLLRIKGIDIEVWANEQQKNMTPGDMAALVKALKAIGLIEIQIKNISDRIILCDIPQEIRLEGRGGNASRIGGVIVKTKEGHKILFPRNRIEDIGNKQYLADLLHEVIELDLIEKGVSVATAHETAIKARYDFLRGGSVRVAKIGRPAVSGSVTEGALVGAMHDAVDLAGAIKTHLASLQKAKMLQGLHRTLKLLAAAMDNDPAILQQSGPMADAKIQSTIDRLSGLNASNVSPENLARIVIAARRQADYDPIVQALVGLTSPAALREPIERPRREERKEGIEERQKIAKLEKLKRKIENNEFPRVALFGDQHGQNAVLERLVEAVENGQMDQVIGHGDGFDRGTENVKNFEAMKKLKNILGDRANFCFGNHDVWLIQALLLGDKNAAANWLAQGGKELVKEFKLEGLYPRELAIWMLKNFKLFHIDERGFMHLHAGIPMDDEGNPLISREQLEKWQEEIQAIQLDMARNPHFIEEVQNIERVVKLFDEAKDVFWIRMDGWVNKFAKRIIINDMNKQRLFALLKHQGLDDQQIDQVWEKVVIQYGEQLKKAGLQFEVLDAPEVDKAKMDRFLAKLGVNGIVFGHEWQDRLMNLDNRIFCIDIHKGDNGFLIFNGDGIRFNALARTDEDLIASKGTILSGISEEIIRLKEVLGEGVVAEEKALAVRKALMSGEEAVAREKIKEFRQDVATYPKDIMRRLKQGLRISWADGLFEFLARESTQAQGALRIQDIKVAGQTIIGVIYREQGRLVKGNSLLIQENQELKIGRDIATGTYSFITGDRVFDLGKFQGQIVLVQRETLFTEESFSLSRKISNMPLEVSLSAEKGATSLTKIEAVLMVSSIEDLMQVAKEMAKLGEYKGLAEPSAQIEREIVAGKATEINRRIETIGGNRQGGNKETTFIGDIWIEAGSFAYKVWVEGDIVFFQRYDRKQGSGQGKARQLNMHTEFQVGREEGVGNDYLLNGDRKLSSRHFRINVSQGERNTYRLVVNDLNSSNGTTVEWNEPRVLTAEAMPENQEALWQTEKGLHDFMARLESNRDESDKHFETLRNLYNNRSVTYGELVRAIGFFTQFSRQGIISNDNDLDKLFQSAEELRTQIRELVMVRDDNYTYADKVSWMSVFRFLDTGIKIYQAQKSDFIKRVEQQSITISIVGDKIIGAMHESIVSYRNVGSSI